MNLNSNFARRLCNFLGLRRERYAVGQHDLACADLGINNGPDDEGPTLHESVQDLKLERDILRGVMLEARTFVQEATERENTDKIKDMVDIERLMSKMSAALYYRRLQREDASWTEPV